MQNKIHAQHWNDSNGNPAGGSTFGNGFAISWQNGPLGRHAPECKTDDPSSVCAPGCTRRPPNGAFVEDVIAAAQDRISYYQNSRFNCAENAQAFFHLKEALAALNERTAGRETRAVEGTHKE